MFKIDLVVGTTYHRGKQERTILEVTDSMVYYVTKTDKRTNDKYKRDFKHGCTIDDFVRWVAKAKEKLMKKEILVFNHDQCLGTIEVEVAEDDLVSVFTGVDDYENPIYICYLAGMDYGVVISKEIYCRMNEAMDVAEDED